MPIDPSIADGLGFHKSVYYGIERERRWLCHSVPNDNVVESESIVDLYVPDTGLRLRAARNLSTGEKRLRFSRKADVDVRTRLITTMYLTDREFSTLQKGLTGNRLSKIRHRLPSPKGTFLAVDEFQDQHRGLILAEAECETDEALAAFPAPSFAIREVTEDSRFSGGHLATSGATPEI